QRRRHGQETGVASKATPPRALETAHIHHKITQPAKKTPRGREVGRERRAATRTEKGKLAWSQEAAEGGSDQAWRTLLRLILPGFSGSPGDHQPQKDADIFACLYREDPKPAAVGVVVP
ncbi:hypothetical protein U9M48_021637, partial [Paspalum notatum var. saurae]